jgi:hypothetical protein
MRDWWRNYWPAHVILLIEFQRDCSRFILTGGYGITFVNSTERFFMPEIYIARSSAIAARLLAGEMMVMNSADSTFFTLNEVATAIWQAADGKTPLREIVHGKVCEQFEVDPGQAQADAEQFVAMLSDHGILLVADHPFVPESAR